MSCVAESATIVPFRAPRAQPQRDGRALLDSVYAAGSLPVEAGDQSTKATAAKLQLFGWVIVDEVQVDGRLRRLRPSETVKATAARPWRLSRPGFEAGQAVRVGGRMG